MGGCKRVIEVRNRLHHWGRWWRRREEPQGYPRRSSDAHLADILRTGIWSSGTSWQDQRAETIQVPGWVAEIDEAVNGLALPHRCALRQQYIGGRRPARAVLLQAEIQIAGMLP